MEKLYSIIIKDPPDISEFEDKEDYYDSYWQLVLNYPLIFLPNNIIVFWGFKVKLLKNEYDLLKTIVELNSEKYSESGYAEDELIENINYHRNNARKNKIEAYQKFISTSTSSIKRKLKEAIVEACIAAIEMYQFNPFVNGAYEEKTIPCALVLIDGVYERKLLSKEGKAKDLSLKEYCKNLKNRKKLKKTILQSSLNLIKVFPQLLNFTTPCTPDNICYKSLIPLEALQKLIKQSNFQENDSKHKYYKTDYIFKEDKTIITYLNETFPKAIGPCFQYAKTTAGKYNMVNFLNKSNIKKM